VQLVLIAGYMVLEAITYKEEHDAFFNSLSWMFTFSVLFSIPAGSVYNGVVTQILSSNRKITLTE
jgi:hypothetical protein